MNPQKNPKLKAAIVGLGRIAHLLENDKKREKPCTHAGTYLAFPEDISICAGMDCDETKKKAFIKRVPEAKFYSSLEKMVLAEKPDILSIATPENTHLQIIKTLSTLTYHPRLIWLEKPVEISYKKAKEIKKISKK